MEFKGTKGKWVYEERPANWFDILEESTGRNVLRNDDLGAEQLLANAQLITHAPEMFEILKQFSVLNCEHYKDLSGFIIKTRALIQKATTI